MSWHAYAPTHSDILMHTYKCTFLPAHVHYYTHEHTHIHIPNTH